MNFRNSAAMLLLAAIWGVSFLLIRIAATVLGPLPLVAARMVLASVALTLFVLLSRRELPALRKDWKAYLILGALNSALPLTLEAVAAVHLNASLTAILATTAPLFTVLASALWLRERLSAGKVFGTLLGLLGVGILVGWSTLPLTFAVVMAVSVALLASLLYALGSIYTKVAFRSAPALSLAIGQDVFAAMLIVPVAVPTLPSSMPPATVLAVTVTLALVMTAGGNLLYFGLIQRVGPTKTQAVSYLVPVFALAAGVIFLGEAPTVGTFVGLTIILIGVALVTEVRLSLPHLGATMSVQRPGVARADGPMSVIQPMLPGPNHMWPASPSPLYDRHSTRRPAFERSTAMC